MSCFLFVFVYPQKHSLVIMSVNPTLLMCYWLYFSDGTKWYWHNLVFGHIKSGRGWKQQQTGFPSLCVCAYVCVSSLSCGCWFICGLSQGTSPSCCCVYLASSFSNSPPIWPPAHFHWLTFIRAKQLWILMSTSMCSCTAPLHTNPFR